MRVALALVLICACGSHAPPPQTPPPGPPPIDPVQLAARLRQDFVTLRDIAHRQLGQCEPLVAELRPHVVGMQAHAGEVARAMQSEDRALRDRVRVEVARYDDELRSVSDTIAADLATTYRSCHDPQPLVDVIRQIPSLP
ncbi:MAG TPA: hypothetical protein VFQ53_15515 [Kofleriaceae bacterium]|nr:hypothetical protein [Kofleriaceae bacterium]